MNVPLLTWICVATTVAMLVLIKLFYMYRRHSFPKHLFGMAHEWEQLYIPGDKIIHDDYDIDDDDC